MLAQAAWGHNTNACKATVESPPTIKILEVTKPCAAALTKIFREILLASLRCFAAYGKYFSPARERAFGGAVAALSLNCRRAD